MKEENYRRVIDEVLAIMDRWRTGNCEICHKKPNDECPQCKRWMYLEVRGMIQKKKGRIEDGECVPTPKTYQCENCKEEMDYNELRYCDK